MNLSIEEITKKSPSANEEQASKTLILLSNAIESIVDKNPKLANMVKKDLYEILNGQHYNEAIARDEVDSMWHGDTIGEMVTIEEVRRFHVNSDTLLDAYVGYNVMFHNLDGINIERDDLMRISEKFWFDEENPTCRDGAVWRYMMSI